MKNTGINLDIPKELKQIMAGGKQNFLRLPSQSGEDDSVAITVRTFDGCGIPADKIIGKIIPVLSQLGVHTVSHLRNFALNKSLQSRSEVEYGLSLAHIEAIEEMFGPKRIVMASTILYTLAVSIFLLLAGFAMAEFTNLDTKSDSISYSKGFSSKAISYESHYSKCNQSDLHMQKWLSLPPSEEGYICMRHTFGRLNNKLQEMTNLLYFANALNRTLVVEHEIGNVYDYYKWQDIFPHVKYRVATTGTHKLWHWCHWGYLVDGRQNKMLMSRGGLQQLKKEIKGKEFVAINAAILFYFRETDYAFLRSFYANLWPKPSVLKKANDFIAEHFGEKPYAAVHLRDLEGSCANRMKRVNYNGYLCSPNKERAMTIYNKLLPGKEELPWFVASDFQKPGARSSYGNEPERHVFKGKCGEGSHECALIDFEICAQANFFIGVFASSASRTIARMREFRQTRRGVFYPSVLHWERDIDNSWHEYNNSWWIDYKEHI
mmetsp:Transcript_8487/g.11096  ORF Transcript_8487/g.11096 Transcript_8487/m.11096 type:complete len:491 (+) Transcript_8487:238-1710(+)